MHPDCRRALYELLDRWGRYMHHFIHTCSVHNHSLSLHHNLSDAGVRVSSAHGTAVDLGQEALNITSVLSVSGVLSQMQL